MIVNGESFPSWFSPHYQPTEPIKPAIPDKVNVVEIELHVEDIFINTESPSSLYTRLEKYRYSNYRIIQHSMDFISIYEIKTNTVVLSDFEYAKKIKVYERKMIEYEKLYNEYLIKKRRYPELHEKYLKVHLSGELFKLESELDECLIQFTKIENEIVSIRAKIEKAKKDLADVNSRNAVV